MSAVGEYIPVEGAIGVGKTTFIDYLCKYLGWTIAPEPVTENPYLVDFYAGKKGIPYVMQDYMQTTRGASMYRAAQTPGMHVLDRSMIGDCAFAWVAHNYGTMDDDEWNDYLKKHKRYMAQTPPPKAIIVMDADVDVLLQRIKVRGRECEQGIKAEYLLDLKEGLKWSIAEFLKIHPVPVHYVNNNFQGDVSKPGSLSASYDLNEATYDEICERLRDFKTGSVMA